MVRLALLTTSCKASPVHYVLPLNGQSEGFDQSFGQRDRSKVVLWIEVIFIGLIYYADQPMSRGSAIRHYSINLA